MKTNYLLLISVFTFNFTVGIAGSNFDKTLDQARIYFYQSIEDEAKLDQAIRLFSELEKNENLEGKSGTYLGALMAIKGKHSFMPHNKLKWVKRGLDIMDEGIEKSPEDIEALFIHGSTNYYLPFFFNRKDDAERSFRKIIKLLPDQFQDYKPELILNVIEFMEQKVNLTSNESKLLNEIKNDLSRE